MKLLRAFVSLLLISVLTLCAVSALAADKPLTIAYLGGTTLQEGATAQVLKTKVNATQSGSIVYSLTDMVAKTVIYTETKSAAAGQEIEWTVPYYAAGMTANKPIKRLRASFGMDGKVYTYDLYYTLNPKDDTVSVERNTWFTKNTACSFGPAFRDVKPGLTESWYTFTPLNLSYPGRQVYEYVASNMYIIGEVYVDVAGDTVTVSYHNFYEKQRGNTKTLEEYFTLFHDLDSVSEVEPEKLGASRFAFGQPISIEKDLEGDDHVLLFVRNRVTYTTYPTDTAKLTRFWPNLPERVEKRNFMMTMMNQ